jgi:hypothetical protein
LRDDDDDDDDDFGNVKIRIPEYGTSVSDREFSI